MPVSVAFAYYYKLHSLCPAQAYPTPYDIILMFFFVKLFAQLFPFRVADGGFGSTGVMAVMEGVKVRNALPYRYLLIRIWKRLSQNCLELYRISDQRAQLLNTDPDDAKCCPLSIILPRLLSESSS
jgi:hypothetical protein